MKRPPKYAEKLLLLFLRDELAEEVLGDLDEKFYSVLASHSPRKARLNYWFQVINYMRPFALKIFRSNSKTLIMFKHNFLISYRILLKNKVFSFINIGGLAMGMTVSILIGLWIHDELSFNKNHDHYDRIVQVLRRDVDGGNVEVNSSLVGKLGVKLQEEYANYFEQVAMTFFRPRPQLLKVGEQSIEEMGYYFQPDIPEILSLEMVTGTRSGLVDASGILLSESLAKKLFRDEDPMGKIVSVNVSRDLIVTGIYRDLPMNSTFGDANFLMSQHLIYNEQNPYGWDNYNMKIYALLRENVELEDASLAIMDILNNELDLGDESIDLLLLPMKDWHLNAYFVNGVQVMSGTMKYLWLYGAVGVLVLLIACINFMNLNTARYQTRSKEVGVRKTFGSFRSNLIAQFMAESMLYAFVALFISFVLVLSILPWFNTVSGKELIIPFSNIWFWVLCIGFTVFSALIAGSYPALFLSSFNPIKALKGNPEQGSGSVRFRQILVVFQFTVSIVLIIGTIVIYQQISYAKDRPVGYEQDNLITMIGRSDEYFQKYDLIRTELKNTGVVEEVAEANYPLMNTLGNNNAFRIGGKKIDATFNTIYVTPEYGSTTRWELVEGRDFSRELDESASIILSESAVEIIGLEDPLGQLLEAPRDFNSRRRFTVVGVVKDMVKGSPFEPAKPLMVFCSEESMRYLFIRINSNTDYLAAIPKIQEAYQEVLPKEGFNFRFVDDEYLTKFRSEEQVGNFAALFSVLAILISCLGLYGLSAFVVSQRVKEIGIRKVIGASVINLWTLLSKDFGVLVIISCLFAIPLAFYVLDGWLASYSYRVELSWWVFVTGSFCCVLITLLTVSYHSLRVSRANPVESLRAE